MARRPKSAVVDSFTTLKAVRDRQSRDEDPSEDAPVENPARSKPSASKASGGRGGIGHTVMPTKHRITCYECECVFTVAGRVGDTGCPKCHTTLKALDRKIEGVSADDIKTIGVVRVLADGVIESGEVWAQDIDLEGRIEGGRVVVGGRLTVHANAKVDPTQLEGLRDLTVLEGACIRTRKKLTLRDVDIKGEVHARIKSDGLVRVRAGGLLKGGVEGEHLQVDEGGGLIGSAKVVGPEDPEADEGVEE